MSAHVLFVLIALVDVTFTSGIPDGLIMAAINPLI